MSPEINPHKYGHPFFKKVQRPIQWKNSSLSRKSYWNNQMSMCKKMNLDPYLTHYTKISSKWITDLIVKPKTRKLQEESIGEILCNQELVKGLLAMTPKAWLIEKWIDKLNFMKIKTSILPIHIFKRTKR